MAEGDQGGTGTGDGGSAGGDAGFIASLPEEMRTEPSMAKFAEGGVAALGKSYMELERKFGATGDHIIRPGKDASDDERNEYQVKLGRPEKADGYVLPAPAEGASFQYDDATKAMVAGFGEVAFKLGLTNDQAAGVLAYYNEQGNLTMDGIGKDAQTFFDQSKVSLQKDFGTAFEQRMALAQSALREFGGEEVVKALQQSGLDNHPAMVKMFANLGEAMSEDGKLPGKGQAGFGRTPQQAKEEIGRLETDGKFMAVYNDADASGHQSAVERMTALFQDAHPEVAEEKL